MIAVCEIFLSVAVHSSTSSLHLVLFCNSANKDFALEVHGLMVSSTVSEAMQKLCTHIHVFKSWTAVGGKANQY